MREVKVIGVGMTHFGKFLERSMKDLTREACSIAFAEANVEPKQIQAAYVGNAMAGLVTGQECIRGQVVLRPLGIGGIPVFNVENACASSSTALHLAWLAVASGAYDLTLALGVEKLYHEDKKKSFMALAAAMDVEIIAQFLALQQPKKPEAGEGEGKPQSESGGRSIFMDFYAIGARMHMQRYGSTQEQFAIISAKNHFHGSLNPHAQYRETYTPEQILASPLVSYPLTRLMCSPIGDGAAAAILASPEMAKKLGAKQPVTVAGSALGSGMDRPMNAPDIVARVSKVAYEMAGLGPGDVNVAEVHDATVYGEVQACEELGFCPAGEGALFGAAGHTKLGGKLPINTSGGLESKGHPVGATGVAQIAELVWQLQGRAGNRQVEGAKVGLTENGGGAIGIEAAAMSVHILKI
jgi:acetyl-CoA acetyltransferase